MPLNIGQNVVTKLGIKQNDVAHNVASAYIKENGMARQFFSSGPAFTFDGTYTTQQVTVDGVLCNLHTLTTSGTLTLGAKSRAFLVAGGAGGANMGKGGSGGFVLDTDVLAGVYVVQIGAGGAAKTDGGATTLTKSATVVYTANGGGCNGKGGSGGGGGNKGSGTAGAGVSTIPFGLSNLYAHSAGGGGGGYHGYTNSMANDYYMGGDGGSDGSNGTASKSANRGYGGTGGNRGGGKGGEGNGANSTNGSDATFYGSGGGGPGVYSGTPKKPGKGYQGVVYVLQKAS